MKTRLTYLGLFTAALLICLGGVQTATAGIRSSATIRTPHIGIQVNTGSVVHYPVADRRMRIPVRRHMAFPVTKHDRKVARRLARYTGASKRELISLRSQGYRWSQIGRWLDLSRGTVRAAMDSHSWKRFLKQQQRHARRRHDRYICYDR